MFRRIFAALFVFVIAVSPALALDKVGIVDISKVIADASAVKSINEQIKGKRDGFQAEIDKKEKELEKEDKELTKQKEALSKEAFAKKQQEFRKKVQGFQKDVQTKRVQLEQASADALTTVQKKLIDVVGEIAKEKDLELVLPKSQTLFAEGGMDITSEVLNGLNKALPKTDVQIKAPKN